MERFTVHPIIGADRPEWCPPGIAMVAPRPLYGFHTVLHPEWGWAGQVIVDPDNRIHITENRRLDAKVVQWFPLARVLDEARAAIEAEVAAEADADVLVEFWSTTPRWVEL
jgi:hypothetical protein